MQHSLPMKCLARGEVDALLQRRDWRHLRPILLAVRDRGVGLVGVFPNAGPLDLGPMLKARPCVILVGADVGFPIGPAAFDRSTLEAAIDAAALVVVVAGEAVHEAYKRAADVATAGGHALIIETTIMDAPGWAMHLDRLLGGGEGTP